MRKCRELRGVMAASLYEPLSAEEQTVLDTHLERCAACRAELAGLEGLKASIPATAAAYEGDLLPAVREALRTRPATMWRRWVFGISMALFAVVVGGVALNLAPGEATPPSDLVAEASPVDQVLTEAARLVEERDLAEAQRYLQAQLARIGREAGAGRAGLMLADVRFDLGSYAASLEAYHQVRGADPEAWEASTDGAKRRFELLSEAQPEDFEPLLALERARLGGFTDLEQVAARWPGRLVAGEAVAAMCALQAEEGQAPGNRVALLRSVAERCREPRALARVQLDLGNAYRDQNDLQRARHVPGGAGVRGRRAGAARG